MGRVGGERERKGNQVVIRNIKWVAVRLVGEQDLVKMRSRALPALRVGGDWERVSSKEERSRRLKLLSTMSGKPSL